MTWQTFLADDGNVAVIIDEQLHWMELQEAEGLAGKIQQLSKLADREKALRASKVAQAKAKQENARHE